LGLIFEDEWIAIAQTLEIFVVVLKQVEREADEIVEVHGAAIGEGALVIGINRQPQLCQGKGSRCPVEQEADFIGS
jgi:hypothetical protein